MSLADAQQCYRFAAFTHDPVLPPLTFIVKIGVLPPPARQDTEMLLYDLHNSSGSAATVTIGNRTTVIQNPSQFQAAFFNAAGIFNLMFYVIGEPYSFSVLLSGVPGSPPGSQLLALPPITSYGGNSTVTSNAISDEYGDHPYGAPVDLADNDCSPVLPAPPVCKVTAITAASPQAANSPQSFPANITVPFNPSISNPPGPGQHLVVFYKDVVNPTTFDITDFTISLSLRTSCANNIPAGKWMLLTGGPEAVLDVASPTKAELVHLKIGGTYKIGYTTPSTDSPGEANVVLPLAGAEVKDVMIRDIALADRFVKAFTTYNFFEQQYVLFQMGLPSTTGNYLGRPDSLKNPTVWMYNQVADTGSLGNNKGKGAVATWYGVPVRISKLSNFIVAYAVQKLGVSPLLQKLAQGFGTKNDRSADDSWKAGVDLASGTITLADMPSLIRTWLSEVEDNGKTRSLWPNPSPVENFVVPDSLRDVNRQFTHPSFLDMTD